MRLLFLIGICFLITTITSAQEPVKIRKTEEKIQIDGILSEQVWKTLKPFSFSEFNPNSGIKDSLTTMYITFDRDHVYIAFKALEPEPQKIIGRSLLRDTWYGDDYVSFHIDPNDTDEHGFIFSVFPEGSRIDIAVSNDAIPLGNATFNGSYDMIWEAKVRKDETGWTAEYKIPIANLRFQRDDDGNAIAGISGLRSQNYRNKRVTFPELPQNVPNAVEMPSLKYPVIFEGLQPKKQLQITPYFTGTLGNRFRLNSEENIYDKEQMNELDAGLDIRYGISQNLTLDVTLNTDFSQVEIDDQVVNINDRVNIFLPEKRKFFQEQAGLFDFNAGILSQLFYSRQIGINNGRLTPVIGGVRLTGQMGKTAVGLLSLQTEGITLGDDTGVPTENFSVVRLRRKIVNNKSFIGFMATNRIRKGYYNTAIGVDNVISFPKDLFLISSLSTTFEKSNTTYNIKDNSRFSVYLDKRKRNGWFYRAAYEFSGDQYNPSMGFLLRERHHNLYAGLNYGKFNTDKNESAFQYNRWTLLNSDLYMNTDFTEVITWYNRSFWSGRSFNGSSFSIFAQAQYENVADTLNFSNTLFVPAGNYRFYYVGASYRSPDQYNFQWPVSIEYGTFFDGTNLRITVAPQLNLGKHFNMQASYRLNKITFPARNQNDWLHIAESRLNWAFNLRLSGSIIGQYNSISNQIIASARLRYNFRDGHDLYVVYNRDYNVERGLLTPQLPAYNNQVLTLKYIYTFF